MPEIKGVNEMSRGYDDKHIEDLENKYGSTFISDEELEKLQKNKTQMLKYKQELVQLENEDKKNDQQRYMSWFALFGMLLYPIFIMISDYLNLQTACTLLSSIAPTYFVSASVIVIIFFGATSLAEKLIQLKGKSNKGLENTNENEE